MVGLSAPREASQAHSLAAERIALSSETGASVPREADEALAERIALSSEPIALAGIVHSASTEHFNFDANVSSASITTYAMAVPAAIYSELPMAATQLSYAVNDFGSHQIYNNYTSSDLAHVPIFDDGLFF